MAIAAVNLIDGSWIQVQRSSRPRWRQLSHSVQPFSTFCRHWLTSFSKAPAFLHRGFLDAGYNTARRSYYDIVINHQVDAVSVRLRQSAVKGGKKRGIRRFQLIEGVE